MAHSCSPRAPQGRTHAPHAHAHRARFHRSRADGARNEPGAAGKEAGSVTKDDDTLGEGRELPEPPRVGEPRAPRLPEQPRARRADCVRAPSETLVTLGIEDTAASSAAAPSSSRRPLRRVRCPAGRRPGGLRRVCGCRCHRSDTSRRASCAPSQRFDRYASLGLSLEEVRAAGGEGSEHSARRMRSVGRRVQGEPESAGTTTPASAGMTPEKACTDWRSTQGRARGTVRGSSQAVRHGALHGVALEVGRQRRHRHAEGASVEARRRVGGDLHRRRPR